MRVKKVFLGLTAATILYAIYNVILDIRDGVFDGLTIVGLLFLLLVAGVFGFLAWLFDGKSPVKRTAEQAKNIVKQEQEKFDAYVSYSPAIKRRIWKFRIIGLILVAMAVWLCIAGNWDTIPVSIATVILIIGIAVFFSSAGLTVTAMLNLPITSPFIILCGKGNFAPTWSFSQNQKPGWFRSPR